MSWTNDWFKISCAVRRTSCTLRCTQRTWCNSPSRPPQPPAARAPGRTHASGRAATSADRVPPRRRRCAGMLRRRRQGLLAQDPRAVARARHARALRATSSGEAITRPSRSLSDGDGETIGRRLAADHLAQRSAAARRRSAMATISTPGNAANDRAWNEPMPPAPTIASLIGWHLTDHSVADPTQRPASVGGRPNRCAGEECVTQSANVSQAGTFDTCVGVRRLPVRALRPEDLQRTTKQRASAALCLPDSTATSQAGSSLRRYHPVRDIRSTLARISSVGSDCRRYLLVSTIPRAFRNCLRVQ